MLVVKLFHVDKLARSVKVNLTIHDGTASSSPPKDYLYQMMPIPVEYDGSNLVRWVEVSIIDDDRTENAETFSCLLSSIDPAIILSPMTTSITIKDNDGEIK